MHISSVGMPSMPSYDFKVDGTPKAVENTAIQQPAADVFESSWENLSEQGLGEKATLPSASADKHKVQLSDEAVVEILGQIVSQDEEGETSPGTVNIASTALMDEDEFQSAGLGIFCVKKMKTDRLPSLDMVKDYAYIKPEDAVENYQTNVRPDLNIVERGCIKAYCSVAYLQMNGYLLGNKKSPLGVVRQANERMNGALERHEVPQGSILYRTASLAELRNYMSSEDYDKFAQMQADCSTKELTPYLEAKIAGTQTKRKTFLSTTINPKFNFQDKPKVATKLYIGENVKGIYVAADRKLSPFPEEEEYLLAPDTKMTVMGVEYNNKNKGFVLHVFAGDVPKNEAQFMSEQQNQAEITLEEAAAAASEDTVALRRESEIASLSKSDIKDLLPADERAQREAKAAEFERLWQARRRSKE